MKTKRIGYIDHRLDNFHANIYLDLLRGDLKTRGWEVAKCWALDEAGGRQWAARKNVSYVSTVADMADCDALVVLAPSTPEVHLELAKLAFPLRKPTYVDKTFAPDLKTAKRIFALADKHRVPVITSSALRCAASLNRTVTELGRDRIRHLRAWGGGRSFEEYVIHPLEMLVAAMGPGVREVMRLSDGANHHELHVRFTGGRTGSVFVHTNGECAFRAVVTTDAKTVHVDTSPDPIFRDLASRILDFFESGSECIDRRETLALFKIRDAAFNAKARGRFLKV